MGNIIDARACMLEDLDFRQAVYTFLSSAFAQEATAEFLSALRDEQPALEGELDGFVHSLAETDIEQVRTDLAAEYARLFLGMSRHPIAPYESVYTSELHLLMQEARDEVLKIYHAEGFSLAQGVSLPEDHIAFEFEFMARLCGKAISALEADDEVEAKRCLEAQARFVKLHLAHWVPELCRDVAERTKVSFYRGVAELAASFVRAEHDLLSDRAA